MRPINRFWLFIYSTPNIVGSLLGLIGLCVFFLGLIKSYWALIVCGLYLVGFIGWPRNEQLNLKMSNELQSEQIEENLKNLISRIKRKVLPEILEKVRSIAALITELLPDVEKDPQYRHILVQTAVDYLPSMLESYLNLPVTFARFHRLKNGKTARQLLMVQLNLLEQKLQSIAGDIHAGNADALLMYSRFLQDKFGKDHSWDL